MNGFFMRPRPSRGFSLVELMVGVAIGMVAVVVIMQVLLTSEQSKRATVGADDSQTTGVIAMATLQRELQQAGAGFAAMRLLGCNITMPGGWVLNGLAPVTINDPSIPAGDANSDTLVVVYGEDVGTPDGDRIVGQPAPNAYTVSNQASFAVGDHVIARTRTSAPVPAGGGCNLTMERLTAIAAGTQQVTVTNGQPGVVNGLLFNLGPAPRIQAFAVRNQSLTVCDMRANNCADAGNANNTNIWVPIATNVVSLRARYGNDTTLPSQDGIVDSYQRARLADGACGVMRTGALQLALVTRSDQYEKEPVTAGPPAWMGSDNAPIVLTHIADWAHFRYRLFQSTVPLKNMNGLVAAMLTNTTTSTLCGL